MEDDRLYDSSTKHDSGYRKALYWAGAQPVNRAVRPRILIRRDKREEETQELRLEERKAVLYDLERSRNNERPSVRNKQRHPQGFAGRKGTVSPHRARRCVIRNLLFLHGLAQRLAKPSSLVLGNKLGKVIFGDILLCALLHEWCEPPKHPHAKDVRN